jgi:hypothetical protein
VSRKMDSPWSDQNHGDWTEFMPPLSPERHQEHSGHLFLGLDHDVAAAQDLVVPIVVN